MARIGGVETGPIDVHSRHMPPSKAQAAVAPSRLRPAAARTPTPNPVSSHTAAPSPPALCPGLLREPLSVAPVFAAANVSITAWNRTGCRT